MMEKCIVWNRKNLYTKYKSKRNVYFQGSNKKTKGELG